MAKGVVDKSDAFFSIAGQVIGPGRERAREELATNPELADALKQAVHPKPTGPALASVRAG